MHPEAGVWVAAAALLAASCHAVHARAPPALQEATALEEGESPRLASENDRLSRGTPNELCLACHGGKPFDLVSAATRTHVARSTPKPPERAVAGLRRPAGRASAGEPQCVECHDRHGHNVLLNRHPSSAGSAPRSATACTLGRIATRDEATEILPGSAEAEGQFCMSPTTAVDGGTGAFHTTAKTVESTAELARTCATCHGPRGDPIPTGFGRLSDQGPTENGEKAPLWGAVARDDDQSLCR
jgi:cytochrome c553